MRKHRKEHKTIQFGAVTSVVIAFALFLVVTTSAQTFTPSAGAESRVENSTIDCTPTVVTIEQEAVDYVRSAMSYSMTDFLLECDPIEPANSNEIEQVDENEVEMLACVIYQEAGGDACTDECRYMAGDIVLNRMMDERFPNSMEEVLTQKRQFGAFYWKGIVWPARAANACEAHAVQRAYDTAKALLSGEHSKIYGQGYVWMAEFTQGKDVIFLDGIYFGR